MKLDLRNNAAAQDMIRIIMREKIYRRRTQLLLQSTVICIKKYLKRATLRLHSTFGDMIILREYGMLSQPLFLI